MSLVAKNRWEKISRKAASRPKVDLELFILDLLEKWRKEPRHVPLKVALQCLGSQAVDWVNDRMPLEDVARVVEEAVDNQNEFPVSPEEYLGAMSKKARSEMSIEELAETFGLY